MRAKILLTVIIATVTLFSYSCGNDPDIPGGGGNNSYGEIRGIISNEEPPHNHIRGARVQLLGTPRTAETSGTGEFVLQNVPAGTHTIRIEHVHYETIEGRATVSTPFHGSMRRRPPTLGTIAGKVIDESGNRITDGHVMLMSGGGARVEPIKDGNFRFDELSMGTRYRVRAFSINFRERDEQFATVPDENVNIPLMEELGSGLRLDKAFIDMGRLNEANEWAAFSIITSDWWTITPNADWIIIDDDQIGQGNATILFRIDRARLAATPREDHLANIIVTTDYSSRNLWVAVSDTNEGINIERIGTGQARNVTANSAIIFGVVLNRELRDNHRERGFLLSTDRNLIDRNPNLARDGRDVESVDASGRFELTLQNLPANTTHYFRAYVINESEGLVLGEIEEFTTDATLPTVITEVVRSEDVNIVNGTALLRGYIESVGAPAYTVRGFVWGTTTVTTDTIFVPGTGRGKFSASVFGLQEGRIYYIQAFATNAMGGIARGIQRSFHTRATPTILRTYEVENWNIGAGTAIFRGFAEQGTFPIAERGFLYSSTGTPSRNFGNRQVVSGTVGSFQEPISGLTQGSIYYIRSYGIDSRGVWEYGNVVSLDFNVTAPTLSTQEPINLNISAGTATFRGRIDNQGDLPILERGFVFSSIGTPTMNDRRVQSDETGADFSVLASNLQSGNTYRIKAFARTSSDYSLSENYASLNFIDPNVITLSGGLMVARQDVSTARLSWASANSQCRGSDLLGYTSWRLPTRDELATLFGNRIAIGGFSTNFGARYWSSTPHSTVFWGQSFDTGEQTANNAASYVRCVRSTQYSYVRFSKIFNDQWITEMMIEDEARNILAAHVFGEATGTSQYFAIQPGRHYTFYFDRWRWRWILVPSSRTHNFVAGRRYTISLVDNLVFSITDDGEAF